MKKLITTDTTKVSLVIGKESGKYYVQTTDITGVEESYLCESIAEGLETLSEAVNTAIPYIIKYNFELEVWC